MDALPSVSILVPTFGRVALLAEVLESVRLQDYTGPLQLIICNDCPAHQLTVAEGAFTGDKSVQVMNLPDPLPTIAHKRNKLLEAATGDLMCVWDDDDIYLPGLVSALVASLKDAEPAARTTRIMMWDGRLATVRRGVLHHNAIFRTDWVRSIGGWREDVETSDADFVNRCVKRGAWRGTHHHVDDGRAPLFLYRGEPGRVHMEGGSPERNRLTVAEFQRKQTAAVSRDRKQRGPVVVVPKWSQDWVAFVADHLLVDSKAATVAIAKKTTKRKKVSK